MDKRGRRPITNGGFVNLELNLLVASLVFLMAALAGALLGGLRAEAFGPAFLAGLFSGWRLTSFLMGILGLTLLFGPSVFDILTKPFRRGRGATGEPGEGGEVG